jgi:hypothetical protein
MINAQSDRTYRFLAGRPPFKEPEPDLMLAADGGKANFCRWMRRRTLF